MTINLKSDRRRFLEGLGTAGLAGVSGVSLGIDNVLAGPTHARLPADWWSRPYRMLQTNLREIDVQEDPREIARAVREFGADVLVTNIGGIVAFYPTKLDLQYVNPYLKGDFVGAMFEAARSEGLRVVGRFDLSKGMGQAYEAHPDWFMRNRDGTPREYAGTYQACPNGGWAHIYGPKILAEAVPLYPADAYFFNMTGYPETDYDNVNHGICTCDNCRAGFRSMYGLELPAKDGFEDPNWVSYLHFQDRTSEALLKKVNGLLKTMRDVPVLGYWFYDVVGRGEVQRRVYRAAPEWPHQAGEQTREAMARNPGRPFSATSAAHIDYPWRQVTETAACHELRFAQQLGAGCAPDLYLMGTLKGQDDQAWLPPVSSLYHWHRKQEEHYAGLVPSARVALYSSRRSARYGGGTQTAKMAGNAFRGAYLALVDSRLPFWMVNDESVAAGTTRLAGQYDAIVMPHVELVSDEEIVALDAFVEAGGLLVATGRTGGHGPDGKPRAGIDFRSFPALAYGTAVRAHGWTANLDKAELSFGQGRMAIDEWYFPLTLRPDARAIVPLAPEQRFGPPEFSYPIPGDQPRDAPVVTMCKFGRGTVVQVPWLPDWLYHRHGLVAHQQMIARIVETYAAPQRFVLAGNGPVELMVMRQPATGRELVHVVNYAGQRNGRYDVPPAIGGLRLGVRGGTDLMAWSLSDDAALPRRTEAGSAYTWFDLPPVRAFTAISLGGR